MKKLSFLGALLCLLATQCAPPDVASTETGKPERSGIPTTAVSDPSKNQGATESGKTPVLDANAKDACKVVGQLIKCTVTGSLDSCRDKSYFTQAVNTVKAKGVRPPALPADPVSCELSCINEVCQYPQATQQSPQP